MRLTQLLAEAWTLEWPLWKHALNKLRSFLCRFIYQTRLARHYAFQEKMITVCACWVISCADEVTQVLTQLFIFTLFSGEWSLRKTAYTNLNSILTTSITKEYVERGVYFGLRRLGTFQRKKSYIWLQTEKFWTASKSSSLQCRQPFRLVRCSMQEPSDCANYCYFFHIQYSMKRVELETTRNCRICGYVMKHRTCEKVNVHIRHWIVKCYHFC